jgi:CBS domain containing-hemolysin-like protein
MLLMIEAKEYYRLNLENDADVETVGEYVFSRLGRPAVLGDDVASVDGHLLRAEELDGLRIPRVRVVPAIGLSAPVDVIAGSAA